MTPEQFVNTYRAIGVNEKGAAQSHFIGLCAILGVPTPLEADPSGETYRFEKAVSKVTGGKGFADVWYAGHFGWEYKGKGADLKRAYEQLLAYREDLRNPPLLVVCDLQTIEVHSNFTGTLKAVERFSLDDLLDEKKRLRLRQLWTAPEAFNPTARADEVTRAVITELVKIGDALKGRGEEPDDVAHFLVKCVFTLFAEDVGLLPHHTFALLLEAAQERPADFQPMAEQLFGLMKGGGLSVVGRIPHINGGVFTQSHAPALTLEDVMTLRRAARRDWRALEPSIFGTLFERVIDPNKRSELGAHYTPLADILDVVEPVMLAPLRAEWEAVRTQLAPLMEAAEQADTLNAGLFAAPAGGGQRAEVVQRLQAFQGRLAAVQMLDPACGSGNFLYTGLRLLLDLEAEVRATLRSLTGQPQPVQVSPRQMLGIERSAYAHEIAGMVLWIGYLQWLAEHGENIKDRSPVLDALPGLEHRDAVLSGTERASWPSAEFITGNPPFLGNKKQRRGLGDEYVTQLHHAYAGEVSGDADFVAYWFEQARSQLLSGAAKRVGLIATSSIRQGKNADVIQKISETSDIFMAWPDRAWVQDGASLRVSIIGFSERTTELKTIYRHTGDEYDPLKRGVRSEKTSAINSDLTSGLNLREAKRLRENTGRSFMGVTTSGKFDITGTEARAWMDLPNPSGVKNTDVLKPYFSGDDITDRNKDRWTIDFTGMKLAEAEKYRIPMQYVINNVKPLRDTNNRELYKKNWWLYAEARPGMRAALSQLSRFIGTSMVAKYRLFTWLTSDIVPSNKVIVIASQDDFDFGVLNSQHHVLWAERLGSKHGVAGDLTYTPTTTYETFPFPQPAPELMESVAEAARFLDQARAYLKTKRDPLRKADVNTSEQENTLTLTGMYNLLSEYRVTGKEKVSGLATLADAHVMLDAAVAAAYGWAWPLAEEEILGRLLALNVERSGSSDAVETSPFPPGVTSHPE